MASIHTQLFFSSLRKILLKIFLHMHIRFFISVILAFIRGFILNQSLFQNICDYLIPGRGFARK
jgi:hypothetical protein